ncbi:MAG TPA: LptF/LptG family permease, partial [Gemmataceae bacterium]|nr:LptF/LptG family permease [Gemmataceae bacterium]
YGRVLQDVFIKKRNEKGGTFDMIMHAREGILRFEPATRELFVDMKQCDMLQGGAVGVMDERTWPIALPPDFCAAAATLRATDMMWDELYECEEKTIDEREELAKEIERHQRQIDRGRAGAHFAEHVQHLTSEWRLRKSQLLALDTERHMRVALALGCFCFALVGCPVGIWFCKSDYLSAFVICFLPIITIYYPALFCMINMARNAKASSWVTIHDANLLLTLVALYLFRRLARN